MLPDASGKIALLLIKYPGPGAEPAPAWFPYKWLVYTPFCRVAWNMSIIWTIRHKKYAGHIRNIFDARVDIQKDCILKQLPYSSTVRLVGSHEVVQIFAMIWTRLFDLIWCQIKLFSSFPVCSLWFYYVFALISWRVSYDVPAFFIFPCRIMFFMSSYDIPTCFW